MTPSPVEALALAYVEHHPELKALMEAQHAKGMEHYGLSISDWKAEAAERATSTLEEALDLLTYLNACDPEVFSIDCHRIANICQNVMRWRDRVTGDPMRSVKRRA